jgi:kynurenine formamidase
MRSSRRRFLFTTAAAGGTLLGRHRAAAHAGPLEASASNAAGGLPVPKGEAAAGQSIDTRVPTAEEILDFYRTRRNWGRWGADDQVGAVNLITPQKRAAAAALVRTGRTVSLGRVFEPPQHFVRITPAPANVGGGYMADYYGYIYHGSAVTHVDALCHSWIREGMWSGRDPAKEIDTSGAHFGDITAWSSRLITRGVLLDVPRHRREPHVTPEKPVHGWELEEIARAQGVNVGAGDALLVYNGRDAYDRAPSKQPNRRPGLHASCAKFIRDHDVAVLVWDMLDACDEVCGPAKPDRVHAVLANFGVALIDNALLEPLAAACMEERRYEFMFVALPLRVLRGSGSAVNPTAIF